MIKISTLLGLSSVLILSSCAFSGNPPGALILGHATAQGGESKISLNVQVDSAGARRVQAVPQVYTKSSIHHMRIQLFFLSSSGSESPTLEPSGEQVAVDVGAQQLDAPIVFENLRGGQKYRARAFAYKTAGTSPSDLISYNNSSFVDIDVSSGEAVSNAVLKVRLADTSFGGAAQTGIVIDGGGLVDASAPSIGTSLSSGGDAGPNSTWDYFLRTFPWGQPDQGADSAPFGMAEDASGTLYYTDTNRNAVYKLPSGGSEVLIAGSEKPGYQEGTERNAEFSHPDSLVLDSRTGNIFVVDTWNHCIRMVDTSGNVSLYAGTPGVSGFVNGSRLSARFNFPTHITYEEDGSLSVVDSDLHYRRITSGGQVESYEPFPEEE